MPRLTLLLAIVGASVTCLAHGAENSNRGRSVGLYSAQSIDDVFAIEQDPSKTPSNVQLVSNRLQGSASYGSDDSDSGKEIRSDVAVPVSFQQYGESATDGFSNAVIATPSNLDEWNPLDTLSLFGGLEGSKQPQDFGVNANFGSRWAANWGFPLISEYGIGAQIGSSINVTDNAVQVFERVGAATHRTQSFSTLGIFQRYNGWSWGVGYDLLHEQYYDNFTLGQWRGRAGYAITPTDEVGVWGTLAQSHGSGMFLNTPVTLTPISQGSVYWQHLFQAGARVMGWMGVSEGHGQVNYALGDLKRTGNQFVFGAEIDIPLNRYVALYGQANFISPVDSGTVDSYLGVAFYPGGHAFPAMRNPFAPLQSLANSTMFAVDLRR